MTKREFFESLLALALPASLLSVCCCCFFLWGSARSQRIHHDEAINVGVAEWQIDSKTGEKRFQYLTPEPKK